MLLRQTIVKNRRTMKLIEGGENGNYSKDER